MIKSLKTSSGRLGLVLASAFASITFFGAAATAIAQAGQSIENAAPVVEITAEELAAAIVTALSALPADATAEEIEAAIAAVIVATGATLDVQQAALASPAVISQSSTLVNGSAALSQVTTAVQTAVTTGATASVVAGAPRTPSPPPPPATPPVVYVN